MTETLLQGDCLKLLGGVKDHSIDLILADLEPGLRTTPRGFVGSCGVTVAENYGVKKIRGGLRDIYLVQITSARQQEELFHWQQPSSKFIQSTADILNNAADDISNESYSEAHAKINWAIGRLEGQSKSLEKIIDEDTCEAE